MNKNMGIEISQLANGFLVRRPYNMARNDCLSTDEMLVFRTMAELQDFLAGHFDWRAKVSLNDSAQTIKMDKKAA